MAKKGGSRKYGTKYPSLFKALVAVGGAITLTGIGVATVDKVINFLNAQGKAFNLGYTVTGTTILGAAGVMWALCNNSYTRGSAPAQMYRTELRKLKLSP